MENLQGYSASVWIPFVPAFLSAAKLDLSRTRIFSLQRRGNSIEVYLVEERRMGNCTVKGTTLSCTADRAAAVAAYRAAVRVRVLTESGGVMELFGPVEVGAFLASFPGHGVFRPGDSTSPLLHHELLQNGRLYYLLPLEDPPPAVESPTAAESPARKVEVVRQQMNGVWRVKLAIEAETLASMLAGGGEETEGFIRRMRMIAGPAEATPPHARNGRGAGGAACKSPAVRHFERA